MPISRIIDEVEPESGTNWDAITDRPLAAATADKASRTGTPAASTAPKATSRMIRVTGRLITAALLRSLPTWSLICGVGRRAAGLFDPQGGKVLLHGRGDSPAAAAPGREAVSGSPRMVTDDQDGLIAGGPHRPGDGGDRRAAPASSCSAR